MTWRSLAAAAMVLCHAPLTMGQGPAGERHVLIVAGAPGSPEHAAAQNQWVDALVKALTGPSRLPASHLVVLRGEAGGGATPATRETVRAAMSDVQRRAGQDDLVGLVLIGHGTFDGASAKFNLVGPDLDASEWADLLRPVRAQLVVVNTTAASFPFLERLAGARRIVVTATDSVAQKFDTVFPQYFAAAFSEDEADLDKDERVSVWEAFARASARVKRHYEERGQLATERALIDDNGDGIGKEAGARGPDGMVASRVFLDAGPAAPVGASPALSELLARRARLLGELDELKRKRTFMPPGDYDLELERLLVEIARVSREVRGQS